MTSLSDLAWRQFWQVTAVASGVAGVRPTIVLPEALAAHRSTDELEPLLAHELIHVRRGDAIVGSLQVAVQGLWWFHPLIWWANRRIAFERERCCDLEVVASLPIEPARYARSLLNVLELKRQLRWLAALRGARPFEITQRRLENIMLRGDRFRSRMRLGHWLTLFVLTLLLVPGAGLTGSSSSVASLPQEGHSKRLSEPAVQTDDAKLQAASAGADLHVVGTYRPAPATVRLLTSWSGQRASPSCWRSRPTDPSSGT